MYVRVIVSDEEDDGDVLWDENESNSSGDHGVDDDDHIVRRISSCWREEFDME